MDASFGIGDHWRWGHPDFTPPVVRDGELRGNGGRSGEVHLVTVEQYPDSQGVELMHVQLLTAHHVVSEAALHIARWDPAQVLTDIAAKRRILEECEANGRQDSHGMARSVLCVLALPYAGHPEYRSEWAPTAEPGNAEPGLSFGRLVVGDVQEDTVMADVHKITSLDETWQPGDVVLDAAGNIRVRSDHPKWVWDYPNEGLTRSNFGGPAVPNGGLEEADVPRPLILLVRDGQAVGGRPIPE